VLLGSRVGRRLLLLSIALLLGSRCWCVALLLGLAVRGPLLLRIWIGLLLSVRVGLTVGGALLSRISSVHRRLAIDDIRGHASADHHRLGKCRSDHRAAAAVAAHRADEYPEEDPSADANPQSPSSDAPDTAGAAGVVPVRAGTRGWAPGVPRPAVARACIPTAPRVSDANAAAVEVGATILTPSVSVGAPAVVPVGTVASGWPAGPTAGAVAIICIPTTVVVTNATVAIEVVGATVLSLSSNCQEDSSDAESANEDH
jgi:hypothetical protein